MISYLKSLLRANRHKARQLARASSLRARLHLDRLEERLPPATTWNFDFGTASSPVAPGYLGVSRAAYSTASQYGWLSPTGLIAKDRGTSSPLTRDFVAGSNGTFLADVPNGSYDFVATLGDAVAAHGSATVWADGQQFATGVTTQSGQFLQVRGRVTVTAGQFSLQLKGGSGTSGFALDALTIAPDNLAATSLWSPSAKPATVSWNDPSAIELGVRFQAATDGYITGIRFYKGPQNSGIHTGSLWTSSGQLLATATFSNETASGWQQVTFSQPVAVKANTIYVASYHSNGYYSADNYYFTVSGQTNGQLYAPSTPESGGDGVYNYGASSFPTNSYKGTNYWVDVVFQPSTPGAPTANAGADQTANEGSAVNFSGSATGTGPLSYYWTFGDGASASGTLTPSHAYADNGTYTATLTVTDAYGKTAQDSAVITVLNVNPTATLSNNGPVLVNSPVTISFSNQFDPSSADTAAGFKYSYDFNNDGTFELTDVSSATASTSYSAAGTYIVRGRIKDKDGGYTDYTTTVTVTTAATGHTYYVATTGSDSNNGSSSAPWFTIQNAVNFVLPGDTVIVRAGSYAGFILGWDAPTAGTAGNPITFEADPAAAAGTVIINARNNKTASGIDLEPGCDYITISGFDIVGGGTIAQYPNKGSGIKVTGNNDIVISNIISNLDYGFGILADNANNVVVENNTITGTGNHGNGDYGHGIYISGSTDGAVVQGNIIHDNSYIGIHINGDLSEGGIGLVTHALIAGNKIYNNGQNGINADGIQDSTIENNLIYGYQGFGIALYQIDAGGPSKNNIIVNNTIVSTVAGAGAAVRMLDASTGNTLYNNILLGGSGIAYRISANSLPGLVSDYNVTGGVYQSEDTGSTQTLAQWRASNGQDAHSFVATATALFVNAAANDYHLSVSSPAIDAGTLIDAPTTDLDGNSRPHGNGIDIGAYEYMG